MTQKLIAIFHFFDNFQLYTPQPITRGLLDPLHPFLTLLLNLTTHDSNTNKKKLGYLNFGIFRYHYKQYITLVNGSTKLTHNYRCGIARKLNCRCVYTDVFLYISLIILLLISYFKKPRIILTLSFST